MKSMLSIAFKQILRTSLACGTATLLSGPATAQEAQYAVGSTTTGVPFTFLDVRTNEIAGVMVDIIEAIGKAEGFSVDVQPTQWSALIPSLTSGKIDIIAAAMYATPERAEVVAFSDPVYGYGEGLIVPVDDDGNYRSLADLSGRTVGVQVGTAYIAPLEESGQFAEIKIYDTLADIMRDVSLGRIDAGFGDRPILAYQLSQGAAEVRLVEDYVSSITGEVAIAVRQDDTELLGEINEGLSLLRENGQMDEIISKWGIR